MTAASFSTTFSQSSKTNVVWGLDCWHFPQPRWMTVFIRPQMRIGNGSLSRTPLRRRALRGPDRRQQRQRT